MMVPIAAIRTHAATRIGAAHKSAALTTAGRDRAARKDAPAIRSAADRLTLGRGVDRWGAVAPVDLELRAVGAVRAANLAAGRDRGRAGPSHRQSAAVRWPATRVWMNGFAGWKTS